MARKPPLPSEILVGRRRPKDATYRDQLLAGFLNDDGRPVGRVNPSDRWLIPAFTKLRREGLISLGVRIGLGRRPGPLDGIWHLRDGDRPLAEAMAAKARVEETREAARVWAVELVAAIKAQQKAEKARAAITTRFSDPEQAQAWMSGVPVPGFGEKTANDLIREGRADEVLDHVKSVEAGVFA